MSEFIDIGLGIVYSLILLALVLIFSNRYYADDRKLRRLVLLAAVLKIFAVFLYTALYKLYYGYGDTLVYYQKSTQVLGYLMDSPHKFWDLIFTDGLDIRTKHAELISKYNTLIDYYNTGTFFVIKFTFFVGCLSFMQYLPMAVIFSGIAFYGSLKLALSFSKLYPEYKLIFHGAFLLIPSVVFWGSCISKDSITIGFANLLIVGLLNIFIFKKAILRNIILVFISFYVSSSVKGYVPLALIPCFSIYLISYYWNESRILKRPILKFLLVFGGIVTFIPIGYFAIKYLMNDFLANQLISIVKMNIGQGVSAKEGDSSFSIGITIEDLQNPTRILFFIPQAIIITLFRPFLWDVRNPIMLISAIESSFFFFFTLFLIFRMRIISFFIQVKRNKLLLFFLLFSLILSIPIGISSGNFGTIVRYKIPILPYYLALLLILYRVQKKREQIKLSMSKH